MNGLNITVILCWNSQSQYLSSKTLSHWKTLLLNKFQLNFIREFRWFSANAMSKCKSNDFKFRHFLMNWFNKSIAAEPQSPHSGGFVYDPHNKINVFKSPFL